MWYPVLPTPCIEIVRLPSDGYHYPTASEILTHVERSPFEYIAFGSIVSITFAVESHSEQEHSLVDLQDSVS